MRRTHNEDCYGILEQERLVLVADGMGGHAAGEVASALATAEVSLFFHQSFVSPKMTWPFERLPTLSDLENRLACGFQVANQRIFERSRESRARKGMGTTLVAAALVDDEICIAHVGDSRCYRIRGSGGERLTRDHSLLEQFKEVYPEMTVEEEKNFPHRNVITRALGLADNVVVDVQTHELRIGDRFLLCSDGLSGHVTDEELYERMAVADTGAKLESTVADLISRANELGGFDNITIVALLIGEP
jgi:serine/threonine protein phosphatase PrpC